MNIAVLVVACITLLAFVAHLFGGTRETAAIAPSQSDTKLSAHWVQAMCAFQMLSVDLLAVTVLLFAIALADLGPVERPMLIGLIVLYASWGLVWMVQVKWLNRPQVGLFRLPHWVVWFVCAGVLVWGL